MSAISFLLQLGGYEDLPGHFIISKALRGYHKEKAAKDSRLFLVGSTKAYIPYKRQILVY
jgi:hypothetical protein